MKGCHILSSLAALAAVASAMPTSPANETELVSRAILPNSASGCGPVSYKPCCIPDICICEKGWIYQFNPENKKAGGNGCDPPWGYLGQTMRQYPGYCCL